MPTPQEEFNEILSNAEKYLKQENELYGDTVFVGKSSGGVKDPLQDSPAVQKTEVDLFGNAVVPSAKKVSEPGLFHYPNEPWVAAQSLDELNRLICNCTKCPLGYTRTKVVFGVGNPKAD
ncbi:MAG TPA: hypothetical protein VI704_07435, partial [Bacteroidota bacterium]|nr:hypothetical protein [Bacteroidota bacterium]